MFAVKKPSKPALILSLLLAATVTAGCSPRFDAAKFVRDAADSRFLGIYDPDYPGLAAISEEDIRASHEACLEAEAEYFRVFFDINKYLIPETLNNDIIRICEKMFASADYEVGEAKKTENGYTVSIIVRPAGVIPKVMSADIGGFTSDWQKRLDSGDFDGMDVARFETLWSTEIIDLVSARIGETYYLEPETVYVSIIKESYSGGVRYAADKDDLAGLARAILPYR